MGRTDDSTRMPFKVGWIVPEWCEVGMAEYFPERSHSK